MNTELRTLKSELRAEADFVLVGKALTYNMPSPDDALMPGVREMIGAGAFADSIRAGGHQGDVVCLINHDYNRVVGRLSNGTLNLYDGPDALRFRCQLDKNNPDHKAVHASVLRGDISQCSFSFIPDKDEFVADTDSKGQQCITRVLRKGQLIDVSAVTKPFYSLPGSTAVAARAAEARALFGRAPNSAADVKEAIAKFRKLTFLDAKFRGVMRDGAVGGTGQGDEMALVRGHLELAHQFAECANAACDTARGIMDSWDDDWDNDQDDDRAAKNSRCGSLRDSFTAAHEAIGDACNGLAACRMHKRLGKPYTPKKKK
jgi:HK97 family phage prohead protease